MSETDELEEHRTQSNFKTFLENVTAIDMIKGVGYGIYYSRKHLFHSFVVIPFGMLVLLTILYGLNQLVTNVFKIRFPGSVLGMLINLFVLIMLIILAELPNKKKSPFLDKISKWSSIILTQYLRFTKPPMNFSLKWINVFFIPSFIILPLSKPITFVECMKIAAVFVIGFVLLLGIDVYLILGLKWVLKTFANKRFDDHPQHAKLSDDEGMEMESLDRGEDRGGVFTSMRDDITTIDLASFKSARGRQAEPSVIDENPFNTREAESVSVNIPPLQEPEPTHTKGGSPTAPLAISNVRTSSILDSVSRNTSPSRGEQEQEMPDENTSECCKSVIIFTTNYIDWILYSVLFIVSIPFYYIKSIHIFLPYHLGLTILAYYIALLVPLRWPQMRKIAHPILVLTGIILFICFIGSLIYHSGDPAGFLQDLKYYKTGKTYVNLFSNKVLLNNGTEHFDESDFTKFPKWPGCGDFLSSLMDISIVSLSLPIFTHRKDFTRNFWVLMPPILVSVAFTFFCYPVVCYNIGISSSRSIGFIGRSVTLALGTPLIGALDGSVSLMAVCTILSGICGVLVGDTLFDFMRVPRSDFVTRGVSLGVNCGAIATAHLLNVDPRAALMSSLGFTIFGTIMIIMASIGAVRDLIKSFAGL